MKIRRLLNKITDYITETAHLNKTFYENEKKPTTNKSAEHPTAQSRYELQNELKRQRLLQVADENRKKMIATTDNICTDKNIVNKSDLIRTKAKMEEQAKRENWKMQTFTDEQVRYQHYRNEIDNHYDRKYDLYSVSGIESIPVKPYSYNPFPNDGSGIQSPVGNIAYVLRMKAGQHATNKRMDLAIACLRKANEIMPISGISWQQKDYLRLCQYLITDGQYDEADNEEKKIFKLFSGDKSLDVNTQYRKKIVSNFKSYNTDLVEMSAHGSTCEGCAKYQGRVFSISGKDKRFPKLPDIVMKTGAMHDGCRHSFSPFYYDISTMRYGTGDPIKYSNRPFVDNRTAEDKEAHKRYLDKINKDDNWWEEWKKREKERNIERNKYEWTLQNLPNLAPKSIGGYMRMKNAQSKNWLKLVEAAKEKGLSIE